MLKIDEDRNCFVCGQENQAGLRLRFQENAISGEAEAAITFPAHMQGWKNTVHGGLLATVLDEVMVQAARAAGLKCVTAEMTVKYRKPAATGTPYRVSGRLTGTKGRITCAEGTLRDEAGTVLASATSKLFAVD